MSTTYQTETQPAEASPNEDYSNTVYAIVGLFLVMVLIWVTVKGKLRDWFMR